MPINGNAATVSVSRKQPTPEQVMRDALQGQTVDMVNVHGDTLKLTMGNGYELTLTVDGGFSELMEAR